MPGIPPIRVKLSDGTFNQIPVFVLEMSGGSLEKINPYTVRYSPPSVAAASSNSLDYGEIYAYAINTNQTLGVASAWTLVRFITSAGSLRNVAVRSASNSLQVANDGVFKAQCNFAFVGGANDEYEMSIGINGVVQSDTVIRRDFAGSPAYGAGAMGGFISLSSGDEVAVYARDLGSASGTFNLEHINLSISSVAATGAGAPNDASYVALGLNGTLTNERVLTASDNITIVDGGANSNVWISATTRDLVTFAPTGGSYISWQADAGLSSEKTLTAGSSVTTHTDATAFYVNATTFDATSLKVYAPTGGNYIAFSADANLSAEKVLTAGSSVTTHTDASAFYVNATTNANISGASYITFAADAALSAEKTLTAGSSVTTHTDATAFYVNATTFNATTLKVYAPTGGNYVAFAADGDLSAEKVITASDNIVINTGATTVGISATTSNISGLVGTGRTVTASTGLTGGGDLSADRTFSVNTNVRDKSLGIFVAGNISTTKDSEEARIYIPFNMELIRVEAAVTTAPTGANLIVDINEHPTPDGAGVSFFDADSRPTITASSFFGSSTGFNVTSMHAGSYLGLDIDQVGSTVAGSNLTITLITRSS